MPKTERLINKFKRLGIEPISIFQYKNDVLTDSLDKVEIIPLPCIHYGHPAHHDMLLKWAINYIAKEPYRFGLFLGDMIENGVINSKGNPYDDLMSPGNQLNDIIEKFKPIKDKIIAVLRGNHENRTIRTVGIDPGGIIAYGLDVPYLGIEGIVKLQFGKDKWDGKQITYSIYAHHGWGNGRTMGAKVNTLDRMTQRVEGCDVYLMAHSHQMLAYPSGVYTVVPRAKAQVKLTQRLMVMCGSFLGGAEYAAEKGYQPTVPGTVIITLLGRTKGAYATIRVGNQLEVQ